MSYYVLFSSLLLKQSFNQYLTKNKILMGKWGWRIENFVKLIPKVILMLYFYNMLLFYSFKLSLTELLIETFVSPYILHSFKIIYERWVFSTLLNIHRYFLNLTLDSDGYVLLNSMTCFVFFHSSVIFWYFHRFFVREAGTLHLQQNLLPFFERWKRGSIFSSWNSICAPNICL